MFLVDSTVWIDFFRGNLSPQVNYLRQALQNENDIYVCGPILTEVLQGIIDQKEHRETKDLFNLLIYLPIARDQYLLAAEIYRAARSKGKIIRKTIDCIIASCSITHKVPFLHNDEDYNVIAKVSDLKCLP